MLCCVNDCGREPHYKAAQLCQMHYFRLWRYGTTDRSVKRSHRIENQAGYQLLWKPTHPLAGKLGYVFEQRAVLYEKLGSVVDACELCGVSLTWKTCKADHIDCDVRNNDPSNLRPLCNRCNTARGRTAPATWNHTHKITFDGLTLTPAEWARDPRVKIAGRTIVVRKKAGLTDAEALFGLKKTHNGKVPVKPPCPAKHTRSNSVRVTIDGETWAAAEWARHPGCGVSVAGLIWRVKRGWNHKAAVFTPPRLKAVKAEFKEKARQLKKETPP